MNTNSSDHKLPILLSGLFCAEQDEDHDHFSSSARLHLDKERVTNNITHDGQVQALMWDEHIELTNDFTLLSKICYQYLTVHLVKMQTSMVSEENPSN